ncbi:MAG: hypothetical protein IBX39_03975 [Candidatus Methanoperedenaceae archaeon]|nr:hypothetical protein [Candidatus Methanoperedenaceae archaeon]MDW7726391.1 hypothetical protein [Candidatus Methanoperedens sp.]
MKLNIQPIGIIKKANSGHSDVLIYSDFKKIIGNIMEKFENGTNLLIVHKNMHEKDEHQVRVSIAELINCKGNLLKVKGIDADDDPVIDVRLGNEI